jgi:hypothetical protein
MSRGGDWPDGATEGERRKALEKMLDAAVAMIKRGDCLQHFGTTRASLSESADVSPNSWDYWFHKRGRRKLKLSEEVAQRMVKTMVEHAAANIGQYDMAGEHLLAERGAPDFPRIARTLFKMALLRDLSDFRDLTGFTFWLSRFQTNPRLGMRRSSGRAWRKDRRSTRLFTTSSGRWRAESSAQEVASGRKELSMRTSRAQWSCGATKTSRTTTRSWTPCFGSFGRRPSQLVVTF